MASTILSSNWKKLQEGLKQQSIQSNGVEKRKANGSLPEKARNRNAKVRRKMGDQFSDEFITEPNQEEPQHRSSGKLGGNAISSNESSLDRKVALAASTAMKPSGVLNIGRTPGLEPGKYVALDCEMVGIGPNPDTNSVLARASLVDYHGTQLYDSFARPMEEVTDYRTAVSGITPALLKNARSFDEVQQDVREILEGRILVGHAVRNDLRALMLGHPHANIRDTSRHRPHRDLVNGAKPALRILASQLLGIEIQNGSHDSVEDARVTMALFRRDKAMFDGETAGPAALKPKPAVASYAASNVHGTKRTGAKHKRKKHVRK